MAEEKKSIFRKESLDRISSPEEYDHYLQVTGPGVWMTLGAIVILLVGAIVWAVFGRLTTTMNVAVIAQGDRVVCMIPVEKAGDLNGEKMTVKVADEELALVDAGYAPLMIGSDTDASIKMAGELLDGSFVYPYDVDAELPEGVYVGKIQVEEIAPIKFIIN